MTLVPNWAILLYSEVKMRTAEEKYDKERGLYYDHKTIYKREPDPVEPVGHIKKNLINSDRQQLKQIIREETQIVLNEKKKTKVSKAGRERVSKKIAILRKKMKPKQAVAVAYSMEKAGELKKDGKHSVVR